jgi:hypothetical protein
MEAPDWMPEPDQVAAVLRARTRGRGSIGAASAAEQGSFTATTRPTAAQVGELIELATTELCGRFAGRSPCTDVLRGAAQVAAVYRAAQLVELSYFPEQVGAAGGAYAALGELWTEAAAAVTAGVEAGCPLDAPGGTP